MKARRPCLCSQRGLEMAGAAKRLQVPDEAFPRPPRRDGKGVMTLTPYKSAILCHTLAAPTVTSPSTSPSTRGPTLWKTLVSASPKNPTAHNHSELKNAPRAPFRGSSVLGCGVSRQPVAGWIPGSYLDPPRQNLRAGDPGSAFVTKAPRLAPGELRLEK